MGDSWISRGIGGLCLATALCTGCAEDDPLDIAGPRSCDIADQNLWVHDLMQTVYLWSPNLPEVDPLAYDTPEELMTDLRYDEFDRWSRISDRETSEALYEEGLTIGVGVRMLREGSRIFLAFVHPESPAGKAGLVRGDELLAIGGLDIETIDAQDAWGDVWGPNEPAVSVALEVGSVDDPAAAPRELTVVKDWYPIETVLFPRVFTTEQGPVGYLVFTSFLETSVAELDAVFADFAEAGVRNVVVDVRYNGGGRIATAHHFMELLLGDTAEGEVAYAAEFEGRLRGENFLRTLNRAAASLSRVEHVVFITTGGSASASELLINGVAAHTKVSIVGSTTAGKPVGSRNFEFCDKIANPITFRLLNADGVTDYFDGLAPDCPAVDDRFARLGDPAEASLTASLQLLAGESCPPLPTPAVRTDVDDEPRSGPRRPPSPLPGAYGGIEGLRGVY